MQPIWPHTIVFGLAKITKPAIASLRPNVPLLGVTLSIEFSFLCQFKSRRRCVRTWHCQICTLTFMISISKTLENLTPQRRAPPRKFHPKDRAPHYHLLGIAHHRSSVSSSRHSCSLIRREDDGSDHLYSKGSADLFCPLHHLRIPHGCLPPPDETETQESMHTSPDDFWSEFVTVVPRRWISSVACLCAGRKRQY